MPFWRRRQQAGPPPTEAAGDATVINLADRRLKARRDAGEPYTADDVLPLLLADGVDPNLALDLVRAMNAAREHEAAGGTWSPPPYPGRP